MKISKNSVVWSSGVVMVAEASGVGLRVGQWPCVVEVEGQAGIFRQSTVDRNEEGDVYGVWYKNADSGHKLLIEND